MADCTFILLEGLANELEKRAHSQLPGLVGGAMALAYGDAALLLRAVITEMQTETQETPDRA